MIDCKKYADEILASVTGYGHLAVISVGKDPASQSYIKGKRKDCERVGFGFTHYAFPADISEDDLIDRIRTLNCMNEITGIIVQLPLPDHLNADEITGYIAASKDVDGFGDCSPFKPCTPEGILYVLRRELGTLTGKHAVIIGRGKLVGKPLAKMLLDEDMTVTVCHSKTPQLDQQILTSVADAVIVAVGKPQEFSFPNLLSNAVLIDCGVHRLPDGKLCGDVAYVNIDRRTPVPGGIGLLTRAMLIKHVERRAKND